MGPRESTQPEEVFFKAGRNAWRIGVTVFNNPYARKGHDVRWKMAEEQWRAGYKAAAEN